MKSHHIHGLLEGVAFSPYALIYHRKVTYLVSAAEGSKPLPPFFALDSNDGR
jgi:hypothetical protein